MSRGSQAYRERDLTKALRAVQKAGVEVARIEIENGKITIVPGKAENKSSDEVGEKNKWDTI